MSSAPLTFLSGPPDLAAIEQAALGAVAYADVFEYPLQVTEVHRYLHGQRATVEATAAALTRLTGPGGALTHREGFYALRGRESLVDVRRTRAARAARLWPVAIRYGHVLAGLPFVRLVAVTGSLAWHNTPDTSDIDYLIVTEPDHLWVCRWLVALLRRLAHLDGVTLCPNYMVTKRALVEAKRDLYTAYEFVRTTPLAGLGMYRRLRRANPWTMEYLPNAVDPPSLPDLHVWQRPSGSHRLRTRLKHLAERVLSSRLGTAVERCEMSYRTRKIMRVSIREKLSAGVPHGDVSCGPDYYKGYGRRAHRQKALAAFARRLASLGASAS